MEVKDKQVKIWLELEEGKDYEINTKEKSLNDIFNIFIDVIKKINGKNMIIKFIK